MKKLTALCLTLTLTCSLAACSHPGSESSTFASQPNAESSLLSSPAKRQLRPLQKRQPQSLKPTKAKRWLSTIRQREIRKKLQMPLRR